MTARPAGRVLVAGRVAAGLVAASLVAAPTSTGWSAASQESPGTRESAGEDSRTGMPADEPAGDPSGTPSGGARRDRTVELSAAELDALTAEVAAQLRCLVCRGQSVLESSAVLSREMKEVIHRRLAAGESPEQVKEYFVSRYGEFILLEPDPRGINLLVYILPAVALIGGIGVGLWALRRWTRAGHAASDGGEATIAEAEPTARPAPSGVNDGAPAGEAGECRAGPPARAEQSGHPPGDGSRLDPADRRWLEEAVRHG